MVATGGIPRKPQLLCSSASSRPACSSWARVPGGTMRSAGRRKCDHSITARARHVSNARCREDPTTVRKLNLLFLRSRKRERLVRKISVADAVELRRVYLTASGAQLHKHVSGALMKQDTRPRTGSRGGISMQNKAKKRTGREIGRTAASRGILPALCAPQIPCEWSPRGGARGGNTCFI